MALSADGALISAGPVSIVELARNMIIRSSNLATNLLLDYTTVEEAQRVLRDAGVNGIELRRGVDDTKAHDQNFNNETTAAGLLDLARGRLGAVA